MYHGDIGGGDICGEDKEIDEETGLAPRCLKTRDTIQNPKANQ
jgi:hypothetical protein